MTKLRKKLTFLSFQKILLGFHNSLQLKKRQNKRSMQKYRIDLLKEILH